MNVLELGISLALTIVVYLAFPLGYFAQFGKVGLKKGRKIACINSVVCCVLFCIVRACISGAETIGTSLVPSVLYYFIVKVILIDPELDKALEDIEKARRAEDERLLEEEKKKYEESSNGSRENNASSVKAEGCYNKNSSDEQRNDGKGVASVDVEEVETVVVDENNDFADLVENGFFYVEANEGEDVEEFMSFLLSKGFALIGKNEGYNWWLVDVLNCKVYYGKDFTAYPKPIGDKKLSIKEFGVIYAMMGHIQPNC